MNAVNATLIPAQPPSLTLGDIYYVLFRHKWKIIGCAIIGLAAAFAVYTYDPPPYTSEAKLFVRYVINERAPGLPATDTSQKSPDQRGETIMNSEREILTSVDLARQVAEAVGPERILAKLGGGNDLTLAAAAVRNGLTVAVPPASSVIHVIFTHPDPTIVQPVVRELIARYLKRHVEVHTANGMLSDFLTQETDQLRSRLSQTETQLRQATSKAGVITVEDAKKAYSTQLTSIQTELFTTEADLAARTAAYEAATKQMPAAAGTPIPEEMPVPDIILDEYRSVSNQLALLHQMEQELLTQFTARNSRVVEVRTEIAKADDARRKLQAKYPRLAQIGAVVARGAAPTGPDLGALASQITALRAKAAVLKQQYSALTEEAERLGQMEGTIGDLRRKKDMEESDYRYFATSLEQARINETLGSGRVSNIIQIQTPSPPFVQNAKRFKKPGMIAGGALAAGIAWAFLIELYLDRSIKRPIDVERIVPAPLLLSVPSLRRKQLLASPGHGANGANASSESNGTNGHAPNGHAPNGHAPNGHAFPVAAHSLAAYHETLRDRIIAYFESIGLNHKPKLVAITGLGAKAGVTTTAVGLARSLSETGDGNVLLVDMTVGNGVAQQFRKGQPACGLDDILSTPDGALVEHQLYVVTENSNSERLSRNMPQRFSKIVPKLKASDFDYVIFDMPPVTQISITPRLAGFMDLVLLVIESERNDRDQAHRATRVLAQSRAHVGVVLNKTRRYVPSRLQPDFIFTAA